MVEGSGAIFSVLFLVLVLGVFTLSIFVNLARHFSISLIFFQRTSILFHRFVLLSYFPFLFFIISFIILGFIFLLFF